MVTLKVWYILRKWWITKEITTREQVLPWTWIYRTTGLWSSQFHRDQLKRKLQAKIRKNHNQDSVKNQIPFNKTPCPNITIQTPWITHKVWTICIYSSKLSTILCLSIIWVSIQIISYNKIYRCMINKGIKIRYKYKIWIISFIGEQRQMGFSQSSKCFNKQMTNWNIKSEWSKI